MPKLDSRTVSAEDVSKPWTKGGPQWLANTHAALDAAATYGWDADVSEVDALGHCWR